MIMNAKEAGKALSLGKKITHENFSDNEWMKLTDNGKYEFEDGVICDHELFWFDRQDESWNEGWSLFENKDQVLEEVFKAPGEDVYMLHNPYRHNTLDLSKPLKRGYYSSVRKDPKFQRNELCPCGSGLKYKKCCLNKKS